jgi:glycosyltransferase involved in cell wall biosynthesis
MSTRLLFVVNIPRFFVSHRLPLALAAKRAGYEVHVATADHDAANLARIRDAGLTLHPISLVQHGRRPVDELRTLLALVRLYRRLRPDILHHVTIKPLLYGGIAGRITGRRAVVAAMSGLGRAFRDTAGNARRPGPTLRLSLRLALPRRTTHLLFQNQDDLDVFHDLGLAVDGRTTLVRGSGVDLQRFRPLPEPAVTDAGPVVLYAGRLMWQKGLGTFAEVAARLDGVARFVVAGYSETGSPDAVPIEQLESWASEGRIEWLGARDDMPEVIAGANLVVLPTVYGEGVPKTLIEAAACGRAIVTTDTPGCRDICRDGINGLLIAPGDVDALERAVRRLAGDADLRARMGSAGRRIAEQEFSIERVVTETLALYERVLPPSHA